MTRPRPVLTATGISGLITSLAGVVAWLGYVAPAADLSARADSIGAVVIGAVTLGSHLLAGLHSQGKVTPVAHPQDHDGTPLVRATSLATAVEQFSESAGTAADRAAVLGSALSVSDVEDMDADVEMVETGA